MLGVTMTFFVTAVRKVILASEVLSLFLLFSDHLYLGEAK